MIAQLPAQPENGFSHYAVLIFCGILSNIITLGLGYWLGLRSQIAAKKLEVKTNMLPLIEKFIIRAKADVRASGENWFGLRPDSIGELLEPATKLKSLLTGRKRKLLIETWERFAKTTSDEFHITQPGEEGKKEQEMRQMFLSRLNAVKAVVENC
jgi:hypothetical protein